MLKIGLGESWQDVTAGAGGKLSLSVCGEGWFILCALSAQCTTGVAPHPAPD